VAEGVGNAPTSAMPILFSRQVQPAYICLPSKIGLAAAGFSRESPAPACTTPKRERYRTPTLAAVPR